MKLMIASDLHGSAFYAKKWLQRVEEEQPDRILLLGDLLYHGPRNDLPEGYAPKEVIPLLNGLAPRLICVRGNCDAEVDQMVLDFPIMADYVLLQAEEHTVFATHGHIHSPEQLPRLQPGDVLLSGHTHVPGHQVREGILCLNPGSLSIPKEDSPHSYLVWDSGELAWKNLDGIIFDRYGK